MKQLIMTITAFARRFMLDYRLRAAALERRGAFSGLGDSSGYVLVIVLIITTLLVAVAGEFIAVSQTNINYMSKMRNRARASFIARSGIELGKYVLFADDKGISPEVLTGKKTDKNIDSYNDLWALDFPPVPLDDEDGTVYLRITDEQSKINLSVLSNEAFMEDHTPYYGMVQRFLINMGLPLDLADIMTDWVDIDDSRSAYGAESSDYYQNQTPPYLAKNAEMDSIMELLLLKDITPEIFYGLGGGNFGLEENLVESNKNAPSLDFARLVSLAGASREDLAAAVDELGEGPTIGRERSRRLSDYLRVHGKREEFNDELNKININTAPFRVLSALTDNMTDDIVTDIISRRRHDPFASVNDLSDVIPDENVRKNLLTVKSNLFRITASATIDNATVTIVAYYNRQNKRILYWSEY